MLIDLKKNYIVFRLLRESFIMSLNSLKNNKLRTFLSLLGISIGIFTIISVFTVIDALENSVRNSISSLGDDVVYLQKWPWGGGGEYKWWEFYQRPQPSLQDRKFLLKRSTIIEHAAFQTTFFKSINYRKNTLDNVQIQAASHDYIQVHYFDIEKGRYFTDFESNNGRNVAIIGGEIAEKLFGAENPVGKYIKIGSFKLMVIGVTKKQGKDLLGLSMDQVLLIPVKFAGHFVNLRSDRLNTTIWVKPKPSYNGQQLMDDLKKNLRAIRRLKPTEKDNFALNKASILSESFGQIFVIIDLAGLIIGGFSILVGGFGIANIMFVSVKEQTKIIGIQKALGAKRKFILQQFLYESVILSLLGGLLGLLFVAILTFVGAQITGMDFSLGIKNVIVGLGLSISIGLIAGLAPANKAAKLDPVIAISGLD